MTFSPDGSRIVTGGWDQTAKVWDAKNGVELLSLKGHRGFVLSVAFSPDGTRIATGSDDSTVKVWDLPVYKETFSPEVKAIGDKIMENNIGWVTCPSCNKKQKYQTGYPQLYCISCWRLFKLENTAEAEIAAEASKDVAACEERLSQIDDLEVAYEEAYQSIKKIYEKLQLVKNKERKERYWKDFQFPVAPKALCGHHAAVYGVAYSPDGSRIVTLGGDCTVKVWDAHNYTEILSLKHNTWVSGVDYSPDGNYIATTSNGFMTIWDAITGKEITCLKEQIGYYTSIKFNPVNSKEILFSTSTHRLNIWDWEDNYTTEVVSKAAHTNSVVFSPDGKLILRGNLNGKLQVCSLNQELLSLEGHKSPVYSVAFSPDGTKFVSGSAYGTAKVWHSGSGKELFSLEGHKGAVYSVAFSSDGSKIITGSDDGTVKLWDAISGEELSEFRYASEVYSVAFSPDGSKIVVGNHDNTAKVCDISHMIKPSSAEAEYMYVFPSNKIEANFTIDDVPVDSPLHEVKAEDLFNKCVADLVVDDILEVEPVDDILEVEPVDDFEVECSPPYEVELVESPEEVPVEVVEGEGEMTELARVTCGQWSQEVHAVGKMISSVRKDLREVFNIHDGAIAQINGVTITDPDYIIKGGDHVEFIRPVGQKG